MQKYRTSLASYLARFQSWLGNVVLDNGAVQGEASRETVRRFRIFAVVVILVNLGYIGEFWFHNVGEGSVAQVRWALAIGWAHWGMAVCMVVLGALAHRVCQSSAVSPRRAVLLQIALSVAVLAFGIALSVLDQWVTTNTTNFASLCLMIGMLSLMRPLMALGIFALAYLGFFLTLPLTQTDPALLAIARSHGLSAVLMSLVASMVVWHQYASAALLRREIALRNQELAEKQAELEFMATRDALTGLYNRREFMRLADMELARGARVAADTGVLMVDLDFFKKINDQYGHPAGDEVLKQVAALLKAGVRATDVVARMGGEEFIVLLPNTGRSGALAVAEKLRSAVCQQPLHVLGAVIPVTASIGVSGVKQLQSASIDGLYAAADQALYRAKQSGRDRVEFLAFDPTGVVLDLAS